MGTYDAVLEVLTDEMLVKYERNDLEPDSFRPIVPKLRAARDDLRDLDEQTELTIPPNRLNTIDATAKNLRMHLDRVLAFKPMQVNNPAGERQGLIDSINQYSVEIIENIHPFLRPDYASISEIARKARAAHGETQKDADEAKELIEKSNQLLQEAAETLAEIKSTAVQTATGRTSGYYLRALEAHRKSALRYLIAAGAFSAILVAMVVIVFYVTPINLPSSNWVPVLIRESLGKLLVLLMLTAAIAFCTKNYRVNKHLETINQTRYNALETASLYVAGVTTDDMRNIIVSELVRAIFAPGDTGYMATDREQTIIENPGSLVGVLGSSSKK